MITGCLLSLSLCPSAGLHSIVVTSTTNFLNASATLNAHRSTFGGSLRTLCSAWASASARLLAHSISLSSPSLFHVRYKKKKDSLKLQLRFPTYKWSYFVVPLIEHVRSRYIHMYAFHTHTYIFLIFTICWPDRDTVGVQLLFLLGHIRLFYII